jgi:hypothetical protein
LSGASGDEAYFSGDDNVQIQTQSKRQGVKVLHALGSPGMGGGTAVFFREWVGKREQTAIGFIKKQIEIFFMKRGMESAGKGGRNRGIWRYTRMMACLGLKMRGQDVRLTFFGFYASFPLACKGVKVIEATSFAKD